MSRPGMTDSRCFTSYVSNCQLNENIQNLNNLQNDSQYRAFLQKNATKIIDSFSNVCSKSAADLCPSGCGNNNMFKLQ